MLQSKIEIEGGRENAAKNVFENLTMVGESCKSPFIEERIGEEDMELSV